MAAARRGQGGFDPAALVDALQPFTISGAEPPSAADAYYRFYDLQFADVCPGLTQRMGYLDAAGERLCVQAFLPPAAQRSAVVCHGYYDHTGIYGHLLRYLLERNIAVLMFDQPGHGLSSGPRATIDSFDRYVEALDACLREASALPAPHYLFGQSMGGAVAVEYLLRNKPAFEAIVLLAPLVRPINWVVNRWVYELARHVVVERPRRMTVDQENPEFADLLRNDPLQARVLPVQWVTAMVNWMNALSRFEAQQREVLVLQGLRDQTVDFRYNLAVLADLFSLTVQELPTARHHLVNEPEPVRRLMWGWLDERLGLAPAKGPD